MREMINSQMPEIDKAVESLELDQHYQQALDLVVSGRARRAFDLEAEPEVNAVHCQATAETVGRTGVEMEALNAVQVALLTVYDMCKAVDRGMTINQVRLLEKSGGKSGHWRRTADRD